MVRAWREFAITAHIDGILDLCEVRYSVQVDGRVGSEQGMARCWLRLEVQHFIPQRAIF